MRTPLLYTCILLSALAQSGCADDSANNAAPVNGGGGSGGSGGTGTGGSLARFAIVGNYFYSVTDRELITFSLDDQGNMAEVARNEVGFGVETMFPYQGQLLLGAADGVFVYDLSVPESPQRVGRFRHITACDPVVARNGFAFSTLRSGEVGCQQRIVNQMDILKLQENGAGDPVLMGSFTDLEQPKGLGIKENTVYVCDADRGVRILDVGDVYNGDDAYNVVEVSALEGFEAFDVIVFEDLLLVIAVDGLRQYDIREPFSPVALSTIPVNS